MIHDALWSGSQKVCETFEGSYWTKICFFIHTVNLAKSGIFIQISPNLPDSQTFQQYWVIKSYLNSIICHNLPFLPRSWRICWNNSGLGIFAVEKKKTKFLDLADSARSGNIWAKFKI
jgi:hypothetical protein